MASISCHCGVCSLEVFDKQPTLSLLCGCEDCRQALEWGATNGAPRPSLLPSLFYLRSDIRKVKGREKMKAVQLREGARSTRVYCQDCYSVLGVDHPAYSNNVFMFLKIIVKQILDFLKKLWQQSISKICPQMKAI